MQRIRIVLDILLENLSDEYKADFFICYFNSKYINDKKASLKYLKYTNRDVSLDLLNLYLDTKNQVFLEPVLVNRNKKLLTNNFFELWHEDLYYSLKVRILNHITLTKAIIEFMEFNESELYLYFLFKKGKISPLELKDKINDNSIKNKYYFIWNLSKCIDFKSLEVLIVNVLK